MDNVVATSTPQPETVKSPDTPKGEGHHHTEVSGDNMPLEIWSKENGGEEYLSKMLNLGDKSEYLPTEVNEQVTSISDYIKERMEQEGYEPTTEAYKSMLNKIQKELGIDKHVSREVMLDRIHGYIDSLSTLAALKNLDDPKLLKQIRSAKSKDEMTKIVMSVVEKYVIK